MFMPCACFWSLLDYQHSSMRHFLRHSRFRNFSAHFQVSTARGQTTSLHSNQSLPLIDSVTQAKYPDPLHWPLRPPNLHLLDQRTPHAVADYHEIHQKHLPANPFYNRVDHVDSQQGSPSTKLLNFIATQVGELFTNTRKLKVIEKC